jgi:hypothetical protein
MYIVFLFAFGWVSPLGTCRSLRTINLWQRRASTPIFWFWRIDDQWFLSVTPTFVFTWDGFRPDKFASGRLAGKKHREHNSALVGQFAMWKFLLTGAGVKSDTSALFEWG